MSQKFLGVYLDKNLLNQIDRCAKTEQRSRSGITRLLFEEALSYRSQSKNPHSTQSTEIPMKARKEES
jgi:metal-responsive CopG/Arc/MetJ family transcriptional regulator